MKKDQRGENGHHLRLEWQLACRTRTDQRAPPEAGVAACLPDEDGPEGGGWAPPEAGVAGCLSDEDRPDGGEWTPPEAGMAGCLLDIDGPEGGEWLRLE